jgi:DNA helicase-2/ATP-dependent DNA helicase PcrA
MAYARTRSYSNARRYSPPAPVKASTFVEHPAHTPQQLEFVRVMVTAMCHVILIARAGTGKTYTMVLAIIRMLAANPALSIAAIAFNKSIASELATKVPAGVVSSTCHSLGVKVLGLNGIKFRLDEYKTQNMLPPAMDKITQNAIAKLVSLCKGQLIDGSNREQLLDLAVAFEVDLGDFADEALHWVPICLKQSRDRTTSIDFDDMIWLPVVLRLPYPKFDVVFVDESQDLNAAQQEFVMMVAERIALVGDDKQAIYRFRGADASAIATMQERLAATKRGLRVMPLTVTRRCAPAIVELAQAYVPDFDGVAERMSAYAADKAAFIRHIIGSGLQGPDPIFFAHHPEHGIVCRDPGCGAQPDRGHMVVCRTNAPLIQAAYHLIRANIPAKIQGRDIASGLVAAIKRLVPAGASVTMLLAALEDHRRKETDRITAQNHGRAQEKLQTLNDRCDCIEALCEGMDTVADVIGRCETLFANVSGDTSNFVLLSSVHRAKGLEADVVHVIRPDQMPHPMARGPEAQAQEQNLIYVAYIRARRELHIH